MVSECVYIGLVGFWLNVFRYMLNTTATPTPTPSANCNLCYTWHQFRVNMECFLCCFYEYIGSNRTRADLCVHFKHDNNKTSAPIKCANTEIKSTENAKTYILCT